MRTVVPYLLLHEGGHFYKQLLLGDSGSHVWDVICGSNIMHLLVDTHFLKKQRNMITLSTI